MYESLDAFCLFVGYPRSGHSLVGSLIDAHPDANVAHEMHALEWIGEGFGRTQLFDALLERSKQFAEAGRRWAGYSYAVPGGWNGRHRELRLIGDKKGGGTTLALAHDPELLDRLRETVRLPLRVIHVTRNPFDNIATMNRRSDGGNGDGKPIPILDSAKFYGWFADVNAELCNALGDELLHVRHEDLIANPSETLQRLFGFLGLSVEDHHVKACTGSIFPVAKRTRHTVHWTPEAISNVEATIEDHDFLRGYRYDERLSELVTSPS